MGCAGSHLPLSGPHSLTLAWPFGDNETNNLPIFQRKDHHPHLPVPLQSVKHSNKDNSDEESAGDLMLKMSHVVSGVSQEPIQRSAVCV